MEGWGGWRARQLHNAVASGLSAQSFPAGLISHLEREGGTPGEGIHQGRTCLLPPPLPIADFTPSQDVMSLHIAGTEGAA